MSIQLFRGSPSISTLSRQRGRALVAAVLLGCFAAVVNARQVNVVIQPPVDSHAHAFIEVIGGPVQTWSFPNSYAGVSELGIRIERLEAFDAAGAKISVRQIAPGQFEAARSAARFRYEVNLEPPAQPSDAARVSWLTFTRGLLMLSDLLPTNRSGEAADRGKIGTAAEDTIVRFTVPNSWAVYSNETQNAAGDPAVIARNEVQKDLAFVVADADRAVFAVGSHLRSSQVSASGMTLRLVADGEWAFADRDALELAANVLKAHHDVFGAMPSKQGTVVLLPFPQTVAASASKWSAETRGTSVTLLIGKLPSKVAALAQLSVPLTHELFHFWVPNGLGLAGDYDWFYEGFTIYQAARTGVRLGLLQFQEFLDAISRAYDAYRIGLDHDRWSLLEASKRRWTGGESAVYSKSMVIAFLYDLKLRSNSRRKRSLDEVYRNIFREHRVSETGPRGRSSGGQGSDGSEVAIEALGSYPGVQDFGRLFIRQAVVINLPELLAPFGLRVETFGLRTRISVTESLTRQQRDLLHDLGYNDYVRSPGQRKPSSR
jgi:hypothetical protein